jgi:hypothetical protein
MRERCVGGFERVKVEDTGGFVDDFVGGFA